jgi:ferredoxin
MRVRVIEEKCQGHGLCRLSAPELFFAKEEDGHAYVKDEKGTRAEPDAFVVVPTGQEDNAQLAEEGCPELAIEVD